MSAVLHFLLLLSRCLFQKRDEGDSATVSQTFREVLYDIASQGWDTRNMRYFILRDERP